MKKLDIMKYYNEHRPLLDFVTRSGINVEKIIPFAYKILDQKEFVNPDETINPQEFSAVAVLVALLASREGKLKLYAQAYGILVYICLKSGDMTHARKFIQASMETLPLEVFEEVLRGISMYDLETNTTTGKLLFRSILQDRSMIEIQRNARWRTIDYWTSFVISRIKNAILGASVGFLIAQLISFILFR